MSTRLAEGRKEGMMERRKGGRSSAVLTLPRDTIQEAASTIQAEQQEEYPGGKSKISQPTARGRCGASVVGSLQHKLLGTHQEELRQS